MSYTLTEQIKIRLRMFHTEVVDSETVVVFDKPEEDFIINELIEKAKNEIRSYRNYPADYEEDVIEEDIMEKHRSILIDLVLYDYSTEGADYEQTHSENGVNRTYISRDKILGKIIPFVKVL